jgi:hypothetical protein
MTDRIASSPTSRVAPKIKSLMEISCGASSPRSSPPRIPAGNSAEKALYAQAITFALCAEMAAEEMDVVGEIDTIFDCPHGTYPSLSIGAYVSRYARYAPVPRTVFTVALILVDRFLSENEGMINLTQRNVHRIWAGAVMVAHKSVDDKFYRLSFWSKVAGLPVAEVRSVEMTFFFRINCGAHVEFDEFCEYDALLGELASTANSHAPIAGNICELHSATSPLGKEVGFC